MSKERWIAAFELAVSEAIDSGMTEDEALSSDAVAERANVICADRLAAMIDEWRLRNDP